MKRWQSNCGVGIHNSIRIYLFQRMTGLCAVELGPAFLKIRCCEPFYNISLARLDLVLVQSSISL